MKIADVVSAYRQLSNGIASISLSKLIAIRWANILLLLLVALWVKWVWHFDLPALPILVIGCFLVLHNTLWHVQLIHLKKDVRLSDVDVFKQLIIDVTAFALLMFFSDGASNPLAALMLLPVVFTTMLRTQWVPWVFGSYTLILYVLLMNFQVPLMQAADNPARAWLLHRLGMGVTFTFSLAILIYLLTRMNQALRLGDAALAQAREKTLQHERVIALGAQAAGAAHELGTPLNTLQLLVDEMDSSGSLDREDILLMKQQIGVCKSILSSLSARAIPEAGAQQSPPMLVTDVLDLLLNRWDLLRPSVPIEKVFQPALLVRYQLAWSDWLTQAMMNLLNNAADVSPAAVALDCVVNDDFVQFSILDRGPGMPTDQIAVWGTDKLASTKGGMGIGLLLSNTAISQHGGEIRQLPREEGGTQLVVTLPLIKGLVDNA
ncbi:hypothetical protein LIN78_04130 [Leeia sp. TBRC 13508]|uniref:histidine kinase n=1 Tax=Leeia speluncae TaxID=2884804 RepID=A0ABS8D3M3_9NEIS|nr:ATP-binding protein [Leeia speluncae]MCB6182742.1 hypothetical protein [Leeia speluncae]